MQKVTTQEELRATILAEVDGLADRLVQIRRDLHAHPEIGYAEHRTTARIVELLTGAGLDPVVLPSGTGATCDILPDGWSADDGLIGLRADIDALPIADSKDVPYASRNPGIAHACGHDVHTTVALGVGLVLASLRRRRDLSRGVRLIFQPAEESSPGGALGTIEGGALDGVTEAYALHCDPRTDVGRIGLKTGPITSAADQVLIKLNGPGGHTSRPHLTADLVGALGVLATSLPLLLSRRVDPRGGASLIWGRISSGTAANAIPQAGEIEGTLRVLDVETWKAAEQLLPELARQLVAPFGVAVDVDLRPGVPPTVNHVDGVHRLSAAAEAILGPTSVTPTEQSLGGEDFSWMLQRVPGAMARLGVRPPGVTHATDIHQPGFDADERCIPIGTRLLLALVTGLGAVAPATSAS